MFLAVKDAHDANRFYTIDLGRGRRGIGEVSYMLTVGRMVSILIAYVLFILTVAILKRSQMISSSDGIPRSLFKPDLKIKGIENRRGGISGCLSKSRHFACLQERARR